MFYTSLTFGGDRNLFSAVHVTQAYIATDKYLSSIVHPEVEEPTLRSLSYTNIREGIYSDSLPMYTGFFDLTGSSNEFRIPHEGTGPGIAWVKIDNLSEALARLVHDYYNESSDAILRYRVTPIIPSDIKAWILTKVVALLSKLARKDLSVT